MRIFRVFKASKFVFPKIPLISGGFFTGMLNSIDIDFLCSYFRDFFTKKSACFLKRNRPIASLLEENYWLGPISFLRKIFAKFFVVKKFVRQSNEFRIDKMPPKKNNNPRFSRKSKSMWKELTLHTTNLMSSRSPFPPKFKAQMQYSARGIFTSGSSGVNATEIILNLNGLVQPSSLNAVQPNGFDQVSPLYGKYQCDYVRVEVAFTNVLTSQAMICLVQVRQNAGAPTMTAVDPILAMDYYGVQSKVCTDTGNDALVKFNFVVPIHKIFGLTRQQYISDPQYTGISLAGSQTNPTTMCYLCMTAGSTTGSVSKTVSFVATLHYTAWFTDRLVFTNS